MREAIKPDQPISIGPDLSVWIDGSGGITVKAMTGEGDPVEITSRQALELAEALVCLAYLDDHLS